MIGTERFKLLAWRIGYRNRPAVSTAPAFRANDATAFALYAVKRGEKFFGSDRIDPHF